MVSRAIAVPDPRLARGVLLRRLMVLAAGLTLALVGAGGVYAGRAHGEAATRCEQYAAASAKRAELVTGRGDRVVVIGDSWSAGLHLPRIVDSWPSRLPGRVHVAGFSGSGFSEGASDCGRVSFADRAPAALRGGADLVVVEGGLNDVDQPAADIRTGFARLMRSLRPWVATGRVVVVGPAPAPSRVRLVPRVDVLLRDLAATYDVPYVDASTWRLPYLPDRLHPTTAGQRDFGDRVADRIAALGLG